MTDKTSPSAPLHRYSFPLFVPANRPERFAKAAASGADSIIVDLEDAVSASDKDEARGLMVEGLKGIEGVDVWVRVNGSSTPWFSGDLDAVRALSVRAVMVPKAESADQLLNVREELPEGTALIALVETAMGVHAAHDIASVSDRMAFGSVDYALDMNCGSTREAFLLARSTLVLAARVADQLAPLDGVTTKTDDPELVNEDAADALSLGFGGKMLIHPRQIEPAREAFKPSLEDIQWAQKIMGMSHDGGAVSLDGEMIDRPVLERAKGIMERGGVI